MNLKDALAAKKNRDTDQKSAAIADVTKEPMKRLNVNLPESVMKQFKAKAVMEGKDMSALVNSWIEEFLKH
ncbi:plasmid partition protein ParG [Thiothrix lacustris]|uniref:plasmid partition protein ParG n=1 Tax=Thiothrix lacustris TaxID=525917 RepID=UPI0027E3C2E2|nr:plasmid partition protein ParG [Thiothrix lacustris]WMP15647.1 plasmid partition protein ParG [Thiothrix lacustris]